MIELRNIKKVYGKDRVLRKVNLRISENGIYIIKGKSGCGKSTLLNIIGLMDEDFKGEYLLDGKNIKRIKNMDEMRSKYFTYLYQKPFFIENETVKTNLSLVDSSLSDSKIEYYLTQVNLLCAKNKIVSSLSGGEKRRLSLLVAFIRKTPILLMDELTSALDEGNKLLVLSLLKEFSRTKIIIFVSHEESIIDEYASKILYFEDRELEYIDEGNNKINYVPSIKRRLSNRYIIKHILHLFKYKKWRTFISLITLCIGLISLGLSFELTSYSKNIVLSSFASSYSTSSVVCQKKNVSEVEKEYISLSFNDIKKISDEYDYYVQGIGRLYKYNFEDNFENNEELRTKDKKIIFNEISLRNVNEYLHISDIDNELVKNVDLKDDEIILCLTKEKYEKLQNYINVFGDEKRIFNYLFNSPVELDLEVTNSKWEYEITIPLKLKGVIISLDGGTSIIHSKLDFNEYILEKTMQLKVNQDFNKDDLYPWTMKKLYYLKVNENDTSKVISLISGNKNYNDYDVHMVKESFAPLYTKSSSLNKMIFFTYSSMERIHESDLDRLLDNEELTSYYLSSPTSYYLVESALIKGFSFPSFISSSKNELEEYADQNEDAVEDLGVYQGSTLLDCPTILYGDILSSSKINSFSLKSYYDKLDNYNFTYPKNTKEIIISSKMKDQLKINIGDNIYFMFLHSVDKNKEKYKNLFKIIPLKVVGVVANSSNSIYVETSWLTSFFIENIFDEYQTIDSTSALLDFSYEVSEEKIKYLNEKYKDYTFTSPLMGLYEEVDKIIHYINIILSVFSFFTLVASFLTLVTVIYLFFEENKGEIATYITLGYTRVSIIKYFFSFGLILGGYSLFTSIINLIVITASISGGNILGASSISLGTILILFIVSFLFSFVSSLIAFSSIKGKKNIEFVSSRN